MKENFDRVRVTVDLKGFPASDVNTFISRLSMNGQEMLRDAKRDNVRLFVHAHSVSLTEPRQVDQRVQELEASAEQAARVAAFQSSTPLFSFDQLILPEILLQKLLVLADASRVHSRVYEEWGLGLIAPFRGTSLNFHGKPGTGKTLAAHALAHRMRKTILEASYAEVESKYHGDGPKNVKALFAAAERDNALLFLDEADSLLSRRIERISQGSEQAINSMRSQLALCLERFSGTVIFATNLVQQYDAAFNSRIRHIHFPEPDEACRMRLWLRHLPDTLPVIGDEHERSALAMQLARIEGLSGRDIRNAVLEAATKAAVQGKSGVCAEELCQSARQILDDAPSKPQDKKAPPLTSHNRKSLRRFGLNMASLRRI